VGAGEAILAGVLPEVAEYPNSFKALGPLDERIETGRFTLCMGSVSTHNTVQRQRFDADELDDVLAEVRSLLRARGRVSTQWEVGSAARPPELVDLLLERGMVRGEDPFAVALVLSCEPPPPPTGAVASRVESLEEYVAAKEVQIAAFQPPAARVAEERASFASRWAAMPDLMHVVRLEGTIVGAGACSPTPYGLVLFGGATVPQARGRGAYGVLIHARWKEAVARGTPALLTQAGAMSRPILERLGFEAVGHVHMLLDEFVDA
jgi:hypothetical protein